MASKKVTTATLCVGTVVAESVSDRSGKLLVGAGEVLSEEHLQNLRAWGVTDVLVEADGGVTNDATSATGADDVIARFALNDVSRAPFPTLLDICQAHVTMGFAP